MDRVAPQKATKPRTRNAHGLAQAHRATDRPAHLVRPRPEQEARPKPMSTHFLDVIFRRPMTFIERTYLHPHQGAYVVPGPDGF